MKEKKMEALRITSHRKIFYALVTATAIAIALAVFISQDQATKPVPGPAREAAAGSALTSPEPFFDFGRISMATGKVSHRFTIENTGRTAITITKLYTSCMCTTATLITLAGKKGPFGMPGHAAIPGIAETLLPEGRAQVEIVFDPAAHGPAGVGRIERAITIQTNAGRPLELGFVAMVTP